MRTIAIFRAWLERLLIVWLVLLSWIAYSWPQWRTAWLPERMVFDPFTQSSGFLKPMFAVTMLAIGSLLPREEVRQVFRRWPSVLGGTAVQYISMPLLAYCVGRLFGLEGPWMIGIVMVGCVPGAMASNVLTLMARGNVSYSVSLTTSATVLSPLIVPWVLWLALGRMVEDFPAWQVCRDLVWMVVIPVIAGHLLAQRFAIWATIARHVAAIIANLAILWIIAVVVGVNRDRISQLDLVLLEALIVVNILGYTAGFLGGWMLGLPSGMRRALTLEVGMQNAGLGTTLAMGLFADQAAALPAALYTFGCMLTGTVLARVWAELSQRAPQLEEVSRSADG